MTCFFWPTEGIDKETLEEIGKYLWRLFRVLQAYKAKNKPMIISSLLDMVEEFRLVFTGV